MFGIQALIVIAVSIMVVAIIFTLAPVIGDQIETSMPAMGATSDWNATHNTDIVTGPQVWGDLSGFLIVVGLVAMAAIIILYLRGVA